VVAVLFARLAGTRGVSGAGMLAVPGWLLILALAQRRTRAVRPDRDTPLGWVPPLLALAVTSIAVFGMALVVLP